MAMFDEIRLLGGVGFNGYSVPCDTLAHSGNFQIPLPANVTIAKAYFFGLQYGNSGSITVTLNGVNYTFDNSTRVGATFNSPYGAASSVHAIDVTSDIVVTVSNYVLQVPAQGSAAFNKYSDYALGIVFSHPSMDVCDVCFYLNDQDFNDDYTWNMSYQIPMDNSKDIGIGVVGSYLCNNTGDGQKVKLNGTLLGTIGATATPPDCTSPLYQNPRGNFLYYNSTLTPLINSNANQAMSDLDALSQANALIGASATTTTMRYETVVNNNSSNGVFMACVAYTDSDPYPFECAAPDPSTMIVSAIGNTTATISWGGCGGGTRSNTVQWRTIGNPTWTTQTVNNANTYNVTGLTALTTYEYQIVNIDCNGAKCAQSIIKQFTTT